MSHKLVDVTPVAGEIPYDNTASGFTATDVQAAIDEVGGRVSPAFSFGREGSSANGTWLRRAGGNIESNRVGVPVPVTNPFIAKIACGTENIATYSVGIYQHEGNSINLTLLHTVNVVSSRFEIFTVNVPITTGKQLAVRCTGNSGGNPNNLAVDLVLKGT